MTAINIRDGVWWVGARDPKLRIFDIVMETKAGTTYNAYLVKAEKTALIDTVKDYSFEELIANVRELVDPAAIDYIVANHTEPDHSGSLARLLELAPKAQVLCSQAAARFLREIVNRDFNVRVVGDGESIDLGGKTLRFISAPFLHWPDSMFTYLSEERILFTCDVFGCHYCDVKLFNDEAERDFSPEFRYYFDVIMGPFKRHVRDALAKIRDLPIDIICPSHGPVLRTNVAEYVSRYADWAREKTPAPGRRAVVAYVSAYGNTGRLAAAIAEGLKERGVEPLLFDLVKSDTRAAVAAIDAADGVLIGSPTLNRDAVKPVWLLLADVSAIVNRGKPAAAFGTYGWSGEAVKLIEDRLAGLQLKVVQPGLRVNFVPSEAQLAEAREFGRKFAAALPESE